VCEADGEWFDSGYDADQCWWTTGTFFLSLLYLDVRQYSNQRWPVRAVGRILEEIYGEEDTYRRVGFVEHLHGELCDK
jgi:hypothetical protein